MPNSICVCYSLAGTPREVRQAWSQSFVQTDCMQMRFLMQSNGG